MGRKATELFCAEERRRSMLYEWYFEHRSKDACNGSQRGATMVSLKGEVNATMEE